jgi:tetratricopeptide (TPR) repeat protein
MKKLATSLLWLGLCSSLGLASGCAAHLQQAPRSISALRADAAASPKDVAAQQHLALAELFAADGDVTSFDAQFARAVVLAPADPRLLFAAGIESDGHAHPTRALDYYLRALSAAPSSQDPIAPHIAELVIHAIGGLQGSVPGYTAKVRPALERALADARLSAPARNGAGTLLMQFAYQRGDRDAAQRIAAGIGCITTFRAVGPFGPRDLLGFDSDKSVQPGKPLADQYDLGPNRGLQKTRDLGARGCSINLGGGPIAEGGTSYAQSYIDVARAGDYVLRFESPNSTALWVDGRSVARVDRRAQLEPDVLFLPLTLSKGRHELTVKLTTRHPNPALSISIAPERPADSRAITLPFSPQSQDGFEVYVRAAVAGARGDVLGARQIMDGIDGRHRTAALLLALRASLLLSDPLQPGDAREDDARRLLLAALARDPDLWSATVQLATMTASNGRNKEAIAALREAAVHWPEVPAVGLTLSALLRQEHWDAEAETVIAGVRKLVPDACAPMAAELDVLRSRQREAQATRMAEAAEQCDAQANARYSTLLRQRRWDEAQKELDRLAALEPPQNRYPWLLARLELAKNRGDQAEVDRQIAAMRALYPRSTTGALEQLDQLASRNGEVDARAGLVQALRSEPDSMADLYRLQPVLGGEHVMQPYRIDGAAKIKAFEASGRKYDGPQLLVFDYMALRIFDDGSSVELVHTIERAQSDESVNDLGEVHVPEGAHVLTLRTIKPDGTRREPDQIEGKDTISLPTIVAGDYVEFEYLRYQDASAGFPDGYSGDRFYFKSFEIPFDHSQMVVVVPKDMPLEIDPRGKAPVPVETRQGDLRVLDFHVDQSTPLTTEPGSVSAREYLPSIRLGVRASWPAFVESIRDVLADRDLYDPELAALVQQIVGEADPSDYALRARRLYSWVLEHIDNNDDLFSQAAVMLRSRSGNRTRVLHYMLGLAGIPSRLALVRSAAADSIPSNMADGDTFEHLLVTYEDTTGPVWLFTVERDAPFGFIPPILRGQPALLLAAGAPRTALPRATPGQDLRQLTLDVTLARDGSAHVDALETLRGAGAVSWRGELEGIPKPELNQRFEGDYVARLLPGARLTTLRISGREQEAESLQLQYAFDLHELGRRAGQSWALPPVLATHLSQTYAQLAQRTTDELIPMPLEAEITVRVHLPKGTARPKLPEPVRLQAAIDGRPSFTMTTRFDPKAPDTIVIERKIGVPLMRVAKAAYSSFAGFCRMVDLAEAKELLVKLP